MAERKPIIDERTRQQIIDAANIVEVVSDFVQLKKKGVNYVGLCPFHNDHSPSFSVNPAKNICKCFVCDAGGTPVSFIQRIEQTDYWSALRYLARKYNIPIVEREMSAEEVANQNERQSLLVLNEFALNFFHDQLLKTEEGQAVGLSYFQKRGISREMVERFRLGYSPKASRALYEEALKRGFKEERLLALGLVGQSEQEGRKSYYDRFRERVIFPIYNLAGAVVGFGGRIMRSDVKAAKYVNSIESPVYEKRRELFGLLQARRAITKEDKVYLVEGYLDVISMVQSGVEAVVASSGTALTEDQVRLIKRFTSNVTLLYDGDSAGMKAALRGADIFLEMGMNTKVIVLEEGEDPDSLAQSMSDEALKQYLQEHEEDFLSFKARYLLAEAGGDPAALSSAISELISSIALIPQPLTQRLYLQSASRLFSVDMPYLEGELRRQQQALQQQGRAAVRPTAPMPQPLPPPEPKREPSPTPLPTAAPQVGVDVLEQPLLELLIALGASYGYMAMIDLEEESLSYEWTTLASYVENNLIYEDFYETVSPLLRAVLTELLQEVIPRGLEAKAYFLNHPDEEFRRLALKVEDELYALLPRFGEELPTEEDIWRLHEEELREIPEERQHELWLKRRFVYRPEDKQLLFHLGQRGYVELSSLKLNLISQKVSQLVQQLALGGLSTEEVQQLLDEISELNELKVYLSNGLGTRTLKK